MSRIIDSSTLLGLSAGEAIIPAVSEDMGNPAWEKAEARILIVRLSPFADVEGSTSHLIIFAECRRALSEAYIDFSFFPDKRDRAILAAQGKSFFFGLESGREALEFDLVLVSNSFALELLNLPYLYSGTGIPSRASARASAASRGASMPIVVLGGSNAASSGSLLFPGAESEEASDCLVDGIFFGEGEAAASGKGRPSGSPALGAIGEIALAAAGRAKPRNRRIEGLVAIDGLWLALSGRPAGRKTLRPYPSRFVDYPLLNSSGSSTARLQISAGCPGYCSFCLEGWESRPYRELPKAEISAAARELKAHTGASCLEIYSYNFNAHADIFELIFELNRVFRRVNFMSQRLDILADSPALADFELAADKRSFTLGIEGISERMRAYFRKGVDSSQIDAAISRLARPSVRELKLFYILSGLEDEDDLEEFAAFAERTAEVNRRDAPGRRLLASVGYLVRLPFTPLQYAALCLDHDRLESLARRMEGACAKAGIEFRLAADFEEYYVDQLLALGGRALAPWLERSPEAGIVYDGTLPRGTGASLEAFARSSLLPADRGKDEGIDDRASSFMSEKPEEWRPPLAFIDENQEALRKNYVQAVAFFGKKAQLPLPLSPGVEALKTLESLVAAKKNFRILFVRLSLPRSLSRATPEYRSSWVMRALSTSEGRAAAAVFDAEEALFGKGAKCEGMVERFWGLACYGLVGPDASRLERAARAAGFEVLEGRPNPERISVELELPSSFARRAESSLRAWLAEERISFIETRDGDYRKLEPSGRDAKKKLLVEALLRSPASNPEGRFEARLELRPKASLPRLISLMSDEAQRAASICVLGFEPAK